MSVKIGSSEWWTETANKVLDTGLNVIQTKLQGVPKTGYGTTTTPYTTTTSSFSRYLPYILGAVGVGAIVVMMKHR